MCSCFEAQELWRDHKAHRRASQSNKYGSRHFKLSQFDLVLLLHFKPFWEKKKAKSVPIWSQCPFLITPRRMTLRSPALLNLHDARSGSVTRRDARFC